jgi:hypothetical protein
MFYIFYDIIAEAIAAQRFSALALLALGRKCHETCGCVTFCDICEGCLSPTDIVWWLAHVRKVPNADKRPVSLLAGYPVTFLGNRLKTGEIGVVRDRQRPTSEITLHLVATFLHKERVLGFGLDPFRQDRQIKTLAETDDCSHDGSVFARDRSAWRSRFLYCSWYCAEQL